ncbi:MAG TPA: hypothetical protein VMW23_02895 [Sedimentisphaerales bacterium]|nr:hypothetical protein [Sedimentisphaerales bacterium]
MIYFPCKALVSWHRIDLLSTGTDNVCTNNAYCKRCVYALELVQNIGDGLIMFTGEKAGIVFMMTGRNC